MRKMGGLTNNDRCEGGGFARRISFGKSPIKGGGGHLQILKFML